MRCSGLSSVADLDLILVCVLTILMLVIVKLLGPLAGGSLLLEDHLVERESARKTIESVAWSAHGTAHCSGQEQQE